MNSCRLPNVKRRPGRHLIVAVLLLVCSNVMAGVEQPDLVLKFSLQAQTLQDSLIEIAEIAGYQIVFQADSVEGKKVPAITGELTLEEVLDQVLRGQKLAYKVVGNVIILTPSPKKQHSQQPKEAIEQQQVYIPEVITVGERHITFCCDSAPSTATKTYVDTIEIPKSLEGITRQLFYDRGNSTLTEALRDYSSVSVVDARGNLNIRGFNLPASAVLKDGHSLVSNGVMPRPLQNIEGIEIAKGVNSSLYGYGEAGGVVNLVSKMPKPEYFTQLTLKAGNQDNELGIDVNRAFSQSLMHRSNLFFRQEDEETAGKLKAEQVQYVADFIYLFEADSQLRWSLEYLKQNQQYGRGLRPFDFDDRAMIIAEVLNLPNIRSTFDLVYPDYFDSLKKQPDYYPTSGADEKEPRRSQVVDLQLSFQSVVFDNWQSTTMLYLGESKEEITYFSDFLILVNTYFDPDNPIITPVLLENLYLSVTGLAVNNVNMGEQFQEVFPYNNVVETLFNSQSAVAIPLWQDGKVHFYQQPFEQQTKSQKISFEYQVNGEQEWLGKHHELLIGTSYVREKSDNTTWNKYSNELYDLGDSYLGENATIEEQALGWALKRYAITTWYDPFAAIDSVKNSLPYTIAQAAGYNADQQFKLDGKLPYSAQKTRIESIGLFMQDNIELADNWRLNMAAGWYHYKSRQYAFETNSLGILIGEQLPMAVTVEPEFSVFTPHAGIVYLPRDDLSLYLSYGEQFNIVHFLGADGSAFEPEETESIEIGGKWWISRELIASIALFDMFRTEWIVNDADNPDFFSQSGELMSRGVEVNLTGFLTPQWKIASNFARHRLKYRLENEVEVQLADVHYNNLTKGVPEKMATLWLQYHWQDYGDYGWSWGVGINYIGESRIEHQRLIIPIDSYMLLDAGISYAHERFRFGFSIDNVTDEEWISGMSGVLSDFGYSPQIKPGNSRRYRLALDVYF